MSNIKSAKKRVIQSEKRKKRNVSQRSTLKTFIKKIYDFIKNGDKKKAKEIFTKTQTIIDRQVSKGLIHINKASRHKSRLIKKINLM